MNKNIFKFAILWLPFLICVNSSYATTVSNSFNVTTSVVAACTVTPSDLNFPNYTTGGVTGSMTLTYNCTTGTTAYYTIDGGLNPLSDGTRQATDGNSNYLTYTLTSDSAGTTLITPTTQTTATADGTAHTDTIYGQMAGSQNVEAGSYADTVNAIMSF